MHPDYMLYIEAHGLCQRLLSSHNAKVSTLRRALLRAHRRYIRLWKSDCPLMQWNDAFEMHEHVRKLHAYMRGEEA